MPPKISLPNLITLSAKFHPHRVKIRYRWNPTTAGFHFLIYLKSASNLNGNLNRSKELEHYAS